MTDAIRPNVPARRPSLTDGEAFARLAEASATRGIMLFATQRLGRQHSYVFRCAQGNEFTRITAEMIRGTTTCQHSAQDELRAPIPKERATLANSSSSFGPIRSTPPSSGIRMHPF